MPDRVVLIDDDPRLVMALQIRLEGSGYEVHTASCGKDGIASAKQHLPHVILLDIHMPGTDGYAVCRFIRKDADLADTPVIVISAVAHEMARRAAFEAGATQFVGKPYQAAELMRMIREAIDGRHGQEMLSCRAGTPGHRAS